MDSVLALVVLIVGVALIFDYINGFHDAANSIATAVATRVLSPRYAVAWAAFWREGDQPLPSGGDSRVESCGPGC